MHPLLVATVICVVVAGVEAIAAGRNPSGFLRSLRQPSWAPPSWAWFVIGVVYYLACLLSLWIVLRHDPSLGFRWRALQAVVAFMTVNAIWNVVFFRLRALALSFWIFLPYVALVLTAVYFLYRLDPQAAVPFVPYLLYLPFGCAWSYRVWRLNRPGLRKL